MRKSVVLGLLLFAAMMMYAVPARRDWQTRIQPDGSSIEVQLIGDEFYHYMINRDGQRVEENDEGFLEVVGDAPTVQQVRTRRAKAQARKQRKEIGVKPNLAPKGVVILVNFKDKAMKAEHTKEVFDELCNSTNCTVNNGYPSAAQYFSDQSNGSYRPQFDVFGPVTLSRDYAFYGENDKDGNDKYATDAVIEACILADKQFPALNFADYDSDGDEIVDFVYVMYAGKGEAEGAGKNTIWPHNWEIFYQVFPFNEDGDYDPEHGTRLSCCYTEEDIVLDGVWLNNYAMSAELSGSAMSGIGTLCHEFGHVIGLPDFYDTNYEYNYENRLTPNEWNIMDGGSYNGGGHCPPNYDAWEKYFMGWLKPENPGTVAQKMVLKANGTEGYKAFQINKSGKQQPSTQQGLNYYIENRQQQGWDKFIPASGMLIWKVNFDSQAWIDNEPNNVNKNPKYTLVIPSGTKIGSGYGEKNVWPYNSLNSWEGVSGKPLIQITRKDDDITLFYLNEITSNTVKWVVNGEVIETREYDVDGIEDLELPAATFDICEGTQFIGWTTHGSWCDPFATPDDLVLEPSGKVTHSITYYALFE